MKQKDFSSDKMIRKIFKVNEAIIALLVVISMLIMLIALIIPLVIE